MIEKNTFWLESVLSKPYKELGRGPASFDCYGLVYYVYNRFFKITIPPFPIPPIHLSAVVHAMESALASETWVELEAPEPGCVVAMSTNVRIHHVGIWSAVDGGMVIHAKDKLFVIASTLHQLRKQHSYQTIKFYRYADTDPHS